MIVLAIPITGLLLLGAASTVSEIRQEHAAADLAQTFREQAQLDLVYQDILNAETSIRGFLLSGQHDVLKPYLVSVASIRSDFETLRHLEGVGTWEGEHLAELGSLIERRLTILAKLRARAPYPSGAPLTLLDRGENLMDQIRTVHDELESAENALLSEGRAANEAAATLSLVTIVVGVAMGLLGGFFAVMLFTSGIARRVGRNEENAKRLERGDPLLPPPDGLDEVGRSGRAFAIAAAIIAEREARLRESTEQLERSNAELQEMQDELRRLSTVDELTGLYNLRGFIPLAEHQLRLCDRSGTSAVIVFMDLDGLKRVNDLFGHEEGSALIVEAVDVIREVVRTSDIVARYGGDEFCALLTGGHESVEAVTRRLLEAITRRNASAARPYELSLSLGTAIYQPGDGVTVEDLMRRADQMMYEQKTAKKAALVP